MTQEEFGCKIGIAGSTLSGYEKGEAKKIDPMLVQKIAELGGISTGELITGNESTSTHIAGVSPQKKGVENPPIKIEGENVPSHAEAANEGINVHQGMMIASKVLSSKTGYAKALWENLKSFEAAVGKETEVEELKRDVREMKEMMKTMLSNQAGHGAGGEKKAVAQ